MLYHRHRPNVLLIITDQQRYDAIGFSNSMVYTPNLDKLAAESTVCTRTYTQSPQCQPSRASLFTGRYPTAHRVWWNGISLPTNELTIGNYLRNAGYHTGYFGKLHFGGEVAKQFGFDSSFLYEDWVKSFRSLNGFKTSGRTMVEHEFYGPMSTKNWTGRINCRELHHDEIVVDRAIGFISEADQPYFCVVGFHGPHPPYAAPDIFSGLYGGLSAPAECGDLSGDEWLTLKAQYYGAVSWIDDSIGRLLRVVDRDTIVVFTSDHGDILGDHGLFSKGIFAYEGTVRVPLLFRVPGVQSGYYHQLAQLIDVVPTILEACGVEANPAIQGRSLLEAMRSGVTVNEFVLSMIGYVRRLRMVCTNQYKYWLVGDDEFLFDLLADPSEDINLDRPELLAQLRLALCQGLIRSEDILPVA